MKKTINHQEKGIGANVSQAVKPRQNDAGQTQGTDVPQKPNQLTFGNLKLEFLYSLQNGSKQDQKQNLLELYLRLNSVRRRTGGQTIRHNQFLEAAQCFAESQGLVFGKHLRNMSFGKLQCS